MLMTPVTSLQRNGGARIFFLGARSLSPFLSLSLPFLLPFPSSLSFPSSSPFLLPLFFPSLSLPCLRSRTL